MVHQVYDTNFPAMRSAFPDAMIIRRTGPGAYVAFDRTGDAVGHPSTIVERKSSL